MKTQEYVSRWVRHLRAIAEKVESGEYDPLPAACQVLGAYEDFLRETYPRAPWLWEDREAKRLWDARPWLNSPPGEIAWWVDAMKWRARGKKLKFFESSELQETIKAISRAYRAKLRRLYGW